MKTLQLNRVGPLIRAASLAVVLIATPASARVLPEGLHKELAQRALDRLWAIAIERYPDKYAGATASERRRLLIDRANVGQVIRIGEVSGMAMWCGVSYEQNQALLDRSGRRYGVEGNTLVYVHLLHNVARDAAHASLKKDECEPKSRDAVRQWMKRHDQHTMDFRHSAPNAMNRTRARLSQAITGVWAERGARVENGRVVSGRGFYIGADGIGATVDSGSGVLRRVLFNAGDEPNLLHVRETENTIVVFRRTLHYDPQNRTLTDKKSGLVLHLVRPEFSDSVRISLGVEPSSNAIRQYFDSEDGLRAFYRIYWHYDDHKAFAVSPMGAWGYSGRRKLSRTAAIEEALRYCNSNVNAGDPPCFVLSVNGSLEKRPAARQQRKRAAIGPALAGLPMNTQMK